MSKIPVNCRFCELPLKSCPHTMRFLEEQKKEAEKTMTREIYIFERRTPKGAVVYRATDVRTVVARDDEQPLGVFVPKKSQLEPLPPSPRVAELELELTQLKESKVREIADLRQANGSAMKEITELRSQLKRMEALYDAAYRNQRDWTVIAQKLADALAKEGS